MRIFSRKKRKKKGEKTRQEERVRRLEDEYISESEADDYCEDEIEKKKTIMIVILAVILLVFLIILLADENNDSFDEAVSQLEVIESSETENSNTEMDELSEVEAGEQEANNSLQDEVSEYQSNESSETETSNTEVNEYSKSEVSKTESNESLKTKLDKPEENELSETKDSNAKVKEISKTEVNDTKVEEAKNQQYSDGVSAGIKVYSLRDEMIKLYKNKSVTYEQFEKYINNYFSIMNLSYKDGEISSEIIDSYNNSIKDISLIDYDKYQIKSIELEYLKGFKDIHRVFMYNQIVHYYYDKDMMSDDNFKMYTDLADEICYHELYTRENLKSIIECGRNVLKSVGDPDKIISDGEWREFKSIEDFSKTKVEEISKTEVDNTKVEEAKNRQYSDGVSAGIKVYSLRDEMIKLYKNKSVTYEQFEKYVNNYFSIMNLSYKDGEISSEIIDSYNNSIKDISLIDYDKYQIKSSEPEYLKGFKNIHQVFMYNQIVHYYYDKDVMSDDNFKVYTDLADKICYYQSYTRENLKSIIECGRNVLKSIGDPDKIISDGEWRLFKSVEDFK